MAQLVSPCAPRSAETAPAPAGYRHEALIWSDLDAFLERTVPFVTEALDTGTPLMVALSERPWAALADALGSDAENVPRLGTTVTSGNPARLMSPWLDFIAQHEGTPIRGIGDPIRPGRRPAEIAECQIHESLLNVAIPAHAPVWLLCPYDAGSLDPQLIDEARRSHPVADHAAAGASYAGADHSHHLTRTTLPAPTQDPVELRFGRGDLASVRHLVTTQSAGVTLDQSRVGDLTLAVNEMAANSVDHGGGHGVLRSWREPDALVFEIEDHGRLTDPLVGRTSPTPTQARGRGVWIAHQLCDLVQIRSTDGGVVVRISTWL